MISYVIPTRDRPEHLARTLAAIERLGPHGPGTRRPGAEVIVMDNASATPASAPERLASGVRVRVIRLSRNMGAAARNLAVHATSPASDWAVMLDDDSAPLDTAFLEALEGAGADVAAVSADITLSEGRGREQGGLPEVFVGCGVALRIPVFIALRGYDESFHYYAEEYDLAARMIRAGYRVAFEPAFRVEHAKAASGRDMGTILSRLVRNNGWVIQRYAPEGVRRATLRQSRRRYRAIAGKEGATGGFAAGLSELRRSVRGQPRHEMSAEQWDRFTGLSAAREALRAEMALRPFRTAALIDRGKNDGVVLAALAELGVRVVDDAASAEARVIGTMSPGPMLDALERRRGEAGPPVVAPWLAARAALSAPRRAA